MKKNIYSFKLIFFINSGKLKFGIPLNVTLEEIRDHASDIYAELTITTKQDLRNILKDFTLDLLVYNQMSLSACQHRNLVHQNKWC